MLLIALVNTASDPQPGPMRHAHRQALGIPRRIFLHTCDMIVEGSKILLFLVALKLVWSISQNLIEGDPWPRARHKPSAPTPSTRSRCRLRDGTLTIGSAEVVRAPKACTCLAKGSHIKGAAEDKGGQTSGSTLMSQKWPSRGPKRTFLPLRGLSKEWAFHCKGGSARKKEPRFLEFSPYHTRLNFAAPFQIQSQCAVRLQLKSFRT